MLRARSSANFYYLHRGVWVLIMAQLSELFPVRGASLLTSQRSPRTQ